MSSGDVEKSKKGMMDTTEVFSSKAEKYAKYRWDYAPQAIQTILEVTQVSRQSSVADIGAGTGILTKHFMGKVKQQQISTDLKFC